MWSSAGEGVKEALAEAVVAERHGAERPGSTGLAIYFPASAEYAATFAGGGVDYPSSIGRFATASLWDDFLTFHYTGETFDAGVGRPERGDPGAGGAERLHQGGRAVRSCRRRPGGRTRVGRGQHRAHHPVDGHADSR